MIAIEFDMLSCLNGRGQSHARVFSGAVYRVSNDGNAFESVYLRPLNGGP